MSGVMKQLNVTVDGDNRKLTTLMSQLFVE